MNIVAVGSRNPVKVAAARTGFGDLFGAVDVRGVDAASGVRAQPVGDEETMRGAIERARNALEAVDGAAWGVGLEGGVAQVCGSLYCMAWCAIVDRQGHLGMASTGRCELPPPVALLISEGMELGEADDIVFGRENSKHSEGAVGLLTQGRIDRAGFYAPAVTMALARYLNAPVFEQPEAQWPRRSSPPDA